eukprot:573302-Alexandrium_andersonii.AAC.1
MGRRFARQPLAPRAATEVVADFRRFRARDKDVSRGGPAWGRSLFLIWNVGPFSMSANELFRAVAL